MHGKVLHDLYNEVLATVPRPGAPPLWTWEELEDWGREVSMQVAERFLAHYSRKASDECPEQDSMEVFP
jgi:hypothetical protein